MGLGDPVTGLFTNEWERFKTGVRALDPDSALRVQEELKRERLAQGERNLVSIPGWDDVVHLSPRRTFTEAERDEFWAAKRAGRAPNLDADTAKGLQDRVDLVRRIRGAPDAEMAQSWGRILTALDNVQDFFSTVSLLGRLALWAAPRIGLRLVPGLNVVILASDLLNALGLIGMTASPLYALLCQGPAGLLAAGVPTLLFKQGLKSKLWALAHTDPRSRLGRLKQVPAALGRKALVGKLIETAQTTDALFGWGLSLGPLVGLVTQGAAAAAIAAQGGTVNVEGNPLSRRLDALINRPLAEDSAPELWALHAAAGVLVGAPALLRRPEAFADDDVLRALVATIEAQRLVYQRLKPYPWPEVVAELADLELEAPLGVDSTSSRTIDELDLTLERGRAWDHPGAPRSMRVGAYVQAVGDELGPALTAWWAARRNTHVGAFVGALVNTGAEEAWRAWTADEASIRWEQHPDWRLYNGLAMAGRLPVATAPVSSLWAFWQAARGELATLGGDNASPAAWDTLAARFGVPLMRTLPPEAPWPEGWRAWLAEQDRAAVTPAVT